MPGDPESPCLAENTLAAFVSGELSATALPGVEAHLAHCADCQDVLAAVVGVVDPATGAPGSVAGSLQAHEGSRVLGGKYRLLYPIGHGGMGSVWEAEHLTLNSLVAVKLIAPEMASDPLALERFLREAQVVAALRSPHVVQVLDYGVDGDTPYIVMERLEGESLADRLTRVGLLSPREAARVVQQVARALGRAHEAGIVHRDLKPENVFVVKDEEDELIKVLDFGIAKASPTAVLRAAPPATRPGVLLGSPYYMSPEQIEASQALDYRSDIWSLGVLAFRCLLGRQPFTGELLAQLIFAICSRALPVPSTLGSVPVGFDAWFARACAREPAARFESARQAAAEFLLLATDEPAAVDGVSAAVPKFQVSTTRPSVHLPLYTTPFVGRETELRQLATLLADPNVRLVTILAPGGMGKSRLAVEAAHRLANGRGAFREVLCNHDVFSRGVFFIDLAPLSSANLIPAALAEVVGFRFYSGQQPEQQLLDYFREKSLLLLMDNFEHVTAGGALVSEILGAAPGIKVLATSRERLGLSAENSFLLDGMGLPDTLEGDALASTAMQLFVQSARRVNPAFELTEQAQDVAQICRLAQGMPLGILLASSWVGMLGAREIADEISKNLDFLQVELADVPKRQRSLRGVFDYSWHLLSTAEQTALSRLSIFRGGFARAAAEAVAETGLSTLAALMNKSLLRRAPKSARYEIHELLRQYAESNLRQGPTEHQATLDRHANYYAQFLRERGARLESAHQPRALQELDVEIGNLRAAWRWMLERRQLDNIGAAIDALGLFYELRTSRAEAEEALRGVVDAFTSPGQTLTGETKRIVSVALSLQIACSMEQGRYQGLSELVTSALALADEPAHRKERALALVTAARAMLGIEPAPRVAAWAEEALALYRTTSDRWGLARALLDRSRMHHVHENLAEAEVNLRESISIQQSLGDGSIVMPLSLIELGYTRAGRGHAREGLQLVLDGLVIAERFGDGWSTEVGLYHLALVQRSLGNIAAAEAAARRCLALRRESGNRFAEARAHIVLGNILNDQDRFAEAAAHFQACLDGSTGDAFRMATAQLGLGELALRRGHRGEAKQLLTESLDRFEKAEIRWGVIRALENLGYLACEEGQYRSALEHFQRAFRTGLSVASVRFISSTAAGVALLLARTDRALLAAELLGLASHYPTVDHATRKQRIEPLLQELESRLSEVELSAAIERGTALDLEVVLNSLQ